MTETENAEPQCIAYIEICLKKTVMCFMCPTAVYWRIANSYVTNQTMHIFFSLHQHVSVSAVTIIRVCYNKRTFTIQKVYKMYHKTTWCYTSFFYNAPYGHKISSYVTVQCSAIGCVRVTRWCSWFRHCAKSRKVAGVTAIFHWPNPSGRIIAVGSTRPPTEMSIRNISWGVKAAGP